MYRTIALTLALVLGAAACGSDDPTSDRSTETATSTDESATADGTTRLWIGPDLVDCVGVAPQTCMLISESEDGEQELFYDQIEGFTHEAGTSYVIDVEITEVDDPPADASSLAYRLVEVVSES